MDPSLNDTIFQDLKKHRVTGMSGRVGGTACFMIRSAHTVEASADRRRSCVCMLAVHIVWMCVSINQGPVYLQLHVGSRQHKMSCVSGGICEKGQMDASRI